MKYTTQKSNDGTIKIIFAGYYAVIIPTINNKYSVCVSCQIGCPVGCLFCYSGKLKFKRNLTSDEILGQVEVAEKIIKKFPTTIVFMGIGEPTLNLKNVLEAAENIHKKYSISYNKLTISTSCLKNLKSLLDCPFNIALSIHTPFDKRRKEIIPNGAKVDEIVKFANEYLKDKNNKKSVLVAYTLIKGINDSVKDLEKLTSLGWPKKTIFNLVEFNDIGKFQRSDKIQEFKSGIIKKGYKCFIRMSRGQDIGAACGMLY